MMFTKFTALFAFSALATVYASPIIITPAENAATSPDVTYPTAGTVWQTGENVTVKWNVNSIPQTGDNGYGLLLLGYETGDGDENLDIQSPLATNFALNTGSVNITVPQVLTRDDYMVVLFGDSGNASPTFTIMNTTI